MEIVLILARKWQVSNICHYVTVEAPLFLFFFFFSGTRDQTQGLVDKHHTTELHSVPSSICKISLNAPLIRSITKMCLTQFLLFRSFMYSWGEKHVRFYIQMWKVFIERKVQNILKWLKESFYNRNLSIWISLGYRKNNILKVGKAEVNKINKIVGHFRPTEVKRWESEPD
jgi:hypothetical protein